MKLCLVVFVTIMVMLLSIARQVNASDSFMDRFSVEVIDGSYELPGMLLGMDKSIVEHPKHLLGDIQGLRGNYELNDRWLLGLTWLKITAKGDGNWARSDTADTLAENFVDGVITGKTDMNLNGVTLDFERRFLGVKSWVRPYVRGGLGAGELTVRFNGQFIGHETFSGFDFPVIEDAKDEVKRTIPLVSAELGLRLMPTKHLVLTMAGFWNTGYGALLGAGWKF